MPIKELIWALLFLKDNVLRAFSTGSTSNIWRKEAAEDVYF
jgi:hypothetical protein